MDILNLGGINEPSERPSKKKLKVIIGIGLLAGVMGMGSTLAASITLNSGNSVEFGQGVQLVAACDPEITITPTSEFVNDTRTGQANFRLKTIAITGIGSGCVGKKLRLTAYTDVVANTQYTLAGSGVTSPLAFAYNYGTSGDKFLPSSGALPLMAGCEFTLATNASSNTDPALMIGTAGTLAFVTCTLNSSTDDSTARTLTRTGTGALLLTFQTGQAAGVAQPVLASAIDKFALESNA